MRLDDATCMELVFRGREDLLLTVGGRIDEDAVRRVAALLGAAVASGARHVIIDLVGARPVSPRLARVVTEVRSEVTTRGGWLLLEGAPPALRELEPELGAVFSAYRAVTAPPSAVLADG
jgi:anti-anti-sigma regulatory factor